MTQASDGAFQVAPISSFIKFTSIPKYYTLNIDEVEEQMQKNEVIYDHYNFMTVKRLQKMNEAEKESVPSGTRLVRTFSSLITFTKYLYLNVYNVVIVKGNIVINHFILVADCYNFTFLALSRS